MSEEIDTFNKFMVGMRAGHICIAAPPMAGLGILRADALLLAAYIVALADPVGDEFQQVLEAVQNT